MYLDLPVTQRLMKHSGMSLVVVSVIGLVLPFDPGSISFAELPWCQGQCLPKESGEVLGIRKSAVVGNVGYLAVGCLQ